MRIWIKRLSYFWFMYYQKHTFWYKIVFFFITFYTLLIQIVHTIFDRKNHRCHYMLCFDCDFIVVYFLLWNALISAYLRIKSEFLYSVKSKNYQMSKIRQVNFLFQDNLEENINLKFLFRVVFHHRFPGNNLYYNFGIEW